MYEGNNDRPTVAETYAGAISSGSSRMEAHRTKPADLIASAGLSPYRMGTALMRLVSEWQSGATPPQPAEAPAAKDLTRQAAVARVNSGITASEEEYGGMRVADKRDRRHRATVTAHEVELGQAEARRLAAQCADWHLHEHRLRFQRLKTLPTVRAALLRWVEEKGWDGARQLVADTIRHFLAPVCPVCQGRKRKVIQSRAIGSECKQCRGTGEKDMEHHGRGRALLAHMKQCTGQAAADLREGAHRLRRSTQSEHDRSNRRRHEKVAQLQRADAEAKADEKADTAGIAAQFRDALGAGCRR